MDRKPTPLAPSHLTSVAITDVNSASCSLMYLGSSGSVTNTTITFASAESQLITLIQNLQKWTAAGAASTIIKPASFEVEYGDGVILSITLRDINCCQWLHVNSASPAYGERFYMVLRNLAGNPSPYGIRQWGFHPFTTNVNL